MLLYCCYLINNLFLCIVVLYSRVCLLWHGFSFRPSRVLHASIPTIIIFCSVRCVDTIVNVILSRLWISCQTLTLPLLTLASRLSATRPSPPPTRSKRSRWKTNSSDFFLPFLRQRRCLPLSFWMFAGFLSGKIKAGNAGASFLLPTSWSSWCQILPLSHPPIT